VRVAGFYVLGGLALAFAIVRGFPVLELGWEAQRLVLVLLAMGLPVALTLAWAADAAPPTVPSDPGAPERAGRPTAWKKVQAEFFQLMPLQGATRETRLAELAGRDAALAEQVGALLKAHDGRGALEELGDRIARVVPGSPAMSDVLQEPSTGSVDEFRTT
jgi:hypothetical protein